MQTPFHCAHEHASVLRGNIWNMIINLTWNKTFCPVNLRKEIVQMTFEKKNALNVSMFVAVMTTFSSGLAG